MLKATNEIKKLKSALTTLLEMAAEDDKGLHIEIEGRET